MDSVWRTTEFLCAFLELAKNSNRKSSFASLDTKDVVHPPATAISVAVAAGKERQLSILFHYI